MSCLKCRLHEGGFRTENIFSEFENSLQRLVESGQLTFLGRKLESRFLEVRYQCNDCGTIWILSVPDQAFRGGWHEE